MNILIKYSVLKYMFSHIRIGNFGAVFSSGTRRFVLKKYINGFCSEILYFKAFVLETDRIKMNFECLILIFIGSAMGFRRFWRHYHDGGRINRIIFVG